MAPLTITPSDPVAKVFLPVPTTLSSAGLEVLLPEDIMLQPGDTTIPLNWKLRLSPDHFGLPLSQQSKKGVTVLAGMIDPDYQDEMSLLLHNGGKEEYAWNTGDPASLNITMPFN
uniref:dUTPase-like domain-containing protein n=1 Tax=Macaca fascicularis TaxID=9541 RepID=A0A7N9CSC0_MACFA